MKERFEERLHEFDRDFSLIDKIMELSNCTRAPKILRHVSLIISGI